VLSKACTPVKWPCVSAAVLLYVKIRKQKIGKKLENLLKISDD